MGLTLEWAVSPPRTSLLDCAGWQHHFHSGLVPGLCLRLSLGRPGEGGHEEPSSTCWGGAAQTQGAERRWVKGSRQSARRLSSEGHSEEEGTGELS